MDQSRLRTKIAVRLRLVFAEADGCAQAGDEENDAGLIDPAGKGVSDYGSTLSLAEDISLGKNPINQQAFDFFAFIRAQCTAFWNFVPLRDASAAASCGGMLRHK